VALVRRTAVLLAVFALAAAAGWAVHWWWRATHPLVPADTPDGWVPRAVVAAGSGIEGFADGPRDRAAFSEPYGVAIGPDDAVYVADAGEVHAIRRIGLDGQVTTIAGGRIRGFADGRGAAAAFDTPSHLAADREGFVYVADTGNDAIRAIGPDGEVTTLVRGGLRGPVGVAVAPDGRLIVADTYNDRIVLVRRDGTIVPVAGTGEPGYADGPGDRAQFDTPAGVAALPDGTLIVADTGNGLLRAIDVHGVVSTLAPGMRLAHPVGIAADRNGRVYVTEQRARVLELAADGVLRPLTSGVAGFTEGLGTAARLRGPAGIAAGTDGRLVVADSGNRVVRRFDLPERLGAWPPMPPAPPFALDASAMSQPPLLWPLEPQDGPHEIAGTLGEPRGNPGGEGRERFHAGVDVRAPQGTPVRAVQDARIDAVVSTGAVNTLSEYFGTGPVTYVHLRVGRDHRDRPIADWAEILDDPSTGRPSRVRIRRGTRLPAGSLLGTVNRFQHVHLNIGLPGEEGNALLAGLPGVVDTVPPIIPPRGIVLTAPDGQPLTERAAGRVVVRGPVRIILEAYDRMDDSPPRRRLGLYRLGYQVLLPDGTPAPGWESPRVTIAFDRLPSSPLAPLTLYAEGSGIPFYGTRVTRFRYVVTSAVNGGQVEEEPWVPLLPPGDYVLRVLAEDAFGNAAESGRDLPIRIEASDPGLAAPGIPVDR
jgi:DNA-binding beta-propeller fold protein YncE